MIPEIIALGVCFLTDSIILLVIDLLIFSISFCFTLETFHISRNLPFSLACPFLVYNVLLIVVLYDFSYFCSGSCKFSFTSDYINMDLLSFFSWVCVKSNQSFKKSFWRIRNWSLLSFYLAFISFVSALICMISFLLLTLGFVYYYFYSFRCKISLLIWDFSYLLRQAINFPLTTAFIVSHGF